MIVKSPGFPPSVLDFISTGGWFTTSGVYVVHSSLGSSLDQSHFYSNGQRSALKSFQKDIQRFLGSFEFQAIANVIIWHEHAMVYAAIPQLPDNLETMIVQALCKLVSSVGEEN